MYSASLISIFIAVSVVWCVDCCIKLGNAETSLYCCCVYFEEKSSTEIKFLIYVIVSYVVYISLI